MRAISQPRLLYLMNEALFFTTHRMPVALAARAQGFEVHVAAPYAAEHVAVIERNGFAYHAISLQRGGQSPIADLRLFLACWRLIRQLRPRLVHHVAMKPILYGGLASRLLGVPATVHAVTGLGHLFVRQDWRARSLRWIVLRLYRLALRHGNARVIFQNRDDLAMFVARGLVAPAATRLIRGTGVDMAVFHPAPTLPWPPLVLFPARLIADKGVYEFVAAARLLKQHGMPGRFVLVGRRDPENPTDVAEATLHGWVADGIVEWWGFRRDMPEVLRQASIVCTPSYREGLPRGLIEAAASGLPIVTTDVPGCREIVEHEATGLLVPARDAPATAAALGRLIADRALCQRLGAEGRRRALRDYALEPFVAATLALYRELLPCPG
ncbi:MAG: glycosyltransferase family 4 protein [Alphaproteobacteria bacterium]|nr:glycosyltransferase family 4 protein [Alphaproteobacteria bacterium]